MKIEPRYKIEIIPDHYSENDKPCWIAQHPELLGCAAYGDTPEIAFERLPIARKMWLDTMQQEFLRLKEEWKKETGFISNMTQIVAHPNYKKIISMGKPAIDFMLQDLKDDGPEFWFSALRELTGAQPVLHEHRGNMKEMTNDWLK